MITPYELVGNKKRSRHEFIKVRVLKSLLGSDPSIRVVAHHLHDEVLSLVFQAEFAQFLSEDDALRLVEGVVLVL